MLLTLMVGVPLMYPVLGALPAHLLGQVSADCALKVATTSVWGNLASPLSSLGTAITVKRIVGAIVSFPAH